MSDHDRDEPLVRGRNQGVSEGWRDTLGFRRWGLGLGFRRWGTWFAPAPLEPAFLGSLASAKRPANGGKIANGCTWGTFGAHI